MKKPGFDKLLHFLVCYGIALSLCLVTQWYVAVAITMFCGVGKELYDKYDYGLFCWKDLLADTLGMASALIYWRLTL